MFEPIFKNTVTLITGASRGIGLACAQRIAQRGGHVIGLARRPFDGEFPGDFYRVARKASAFRPGMNSADSSAVLAVCILNSRIYCL